MRYYTKSNPEKSVSTPKQKTGIDTTTFSSKISLKDG